MTRAGLKHGYNHKWKEQDLRQTLRKRRTTFFNMSEYFGALSELMGCSSRRLSSSTTRQLLKASIRGIAFHI